MRQRIVHILRTHVVQCGIPDGVLLGEQVCEELRRDEEMERGHEDTTNKNTEKCSIRLMTSVSEIRRKKAL